MRRALLLCLSLSVGVGCAADRAPAGAEPSAEQVEAETSRLNAWFDARHEELLQKSPIATTFLGRKDNYDRIDEMTEAAADEELAWRRHTVETLKRDFDYARLTPEAQTSYDIWVDQFEQADRHAEDSGTA